MKCEHGVYVPEGDGTTSRYCGLCNPSAYSDTVLLKALQGRPISRGGYAEPHTDDVAEFMLRPANDRIAEAVFSD